MLPGDEHPDDVPMVRYECNACEMVATCVHNATSELAWEDHMAIHEPTASYRAWTWLVTPLPFHSRISPT